MLKYSHFCLKQADIAQLVERWLPKPKVASSSLVVRSRLMDRVVPCTISGRVRFSLSEHGIIAQPNRCANAGAGCLSRRFFLIGGAKIECFTWSSGCRLIYESMAHGDGPCFCSIRGLYFRYGSELAFFPINKPCFLPDSTDVRN